MNNTDNFVKVISEEEHNKHQKQYRDDLMSRRSEKILDILDGKSKAQLIDIINLYEDFPKSKNLDRMSVEELKQEIHKDLMLRFITRRGLM